MILHHGEWYLYEGWSIRPNGTACKRAGHYPGYVRLRNMLTDKVLDIRSDLVTVH